MIALLIGVCGALGVFYLYTAAIGWKGVGLTPTTDHVAGEYFNWEIGLGIAP
jgi:hypothetical protein